MQIGSGWCKGMRIETPEGTDTRPTRSRIRQSVLNILQPWTPEASILEIFAGSGSLGLELLSRGGSSALFIENEPKAIKSLRQNVDSLKARALKQSISLGTLSILNSDAFTCLDSKSQPLFNIISADPPYKLVGEFLESCQHQVWSLVGPGGVFVLESGIEWEGEAIDKLCPELSAFKMKQKTYGVTLITIWEKP